VCVLVVVLRFRIGLGPYLGGTYMYVDQVDPARKRYKITSTMYMCVGRGMKPNYVVVHFTKAWKYIDFGRICTYVCRYSTYSINMCYPATGTIEM
jgi:hypothetical protein